MSVDLTSTHIVGDRVKWMSKAFAAPSFTGYRVPWPMEGEIHDVPVVGTLPTWINGSYYRTGPNPQFVPRGRYASWYDGDGMVHGFHFRNGRVDYVNRWVRTERFRMERAAGHALFGTLYEPDSGDPAVADRSRNAANAAIVRHGGRLLVTWETGLPHELDPLTLQTRGLWDFGGAIPWDMMAHPKVDPVSGEMHLFGRTAPHPEPGKTTYHVVGSDGQVVHTTEIDVPYDSMTHDMFMTEDYVVLGVFPVCYDAARARRGGPYIAWEADRRAFLGVLPKGAPGRDMIWVEFEPCFGSHTMNAYQEGNTIVCDTIRYRRNMLFPDPDGSWDFAPTPPSLYRWRINAARDSVTAAAFDDSSGEMPGMDLRFCGRPYRHGFSAGFTEPGADFQTLFHYDWQTGQRDTYSPGPGFYTQEPVFVPRTPDGPEGDGYLLALQYDVAHDRSELLVLEALDLAAGPIARVQLPHRTGSGLHGAWCPA